ncbi:hypothetical protein MSAN_02236300 [Mycena sanguinolenta]|uniref:Uncharacterized protein n=1 Tax=Mycena sanguinolenta TaxID=230812 RepID=A0A8H7CHI5_9AGAR|nr:hypothetical protein MSAN_02236300 [Mycena sanguinolenta]
MSVATEMRTVTGIVSVSRPAPPRSLVISPNLDALLEHDERVRRAQSPVVSPVVPYGLPPPPRRTRTPGSPQLFSPPPPPLPVPAQRSPVLPPGLGQDDQRSNTPQSVDSNPYINPAPQWVDATPVATSPVPISPPPRTSSMGQGIERDPGLGGPSRGFDVGVGRARTASGDRPHVADIFGFGNNNNKTNAPVAHRQSDGSSHSQFESPSSSSASSPVAESRSFLRRSKDSACSSNINEKGKAKGKDKEKVKDKGKEREKDKGKEREKEEIALSPSLRPSRSKGKLTKPQPRDTATSTSTTHSTASRDTSPPMFEPVRRVRKQRSARSISVSSAISNSDRESFIDLFSPSNQDFDSELAEGPFVAAAPPSPLPPAPPSKSHLARDPREARSVSDPQARDKSRSQSNDKGRVKSRDKSRDSEGKVKPPIPTTPKPDFSRRSIVPGTVSSSPPAPRQGPRRPSPSARYTPDTMPPTTNFLNPAERAQLVRKSRKLAQVFGQTPGAAAIVPDSIAGSSSSFLDIAPGAGGKGARGGKGHRVAASMNILSQLPGGTQRPLPPWPAQEKTIYMNANGRSHSTPSTPVDDEYAEMGQTISVSRHSDDMAASPRSFMDFGVESPLNAENEEPAAHPNNDNGSPSNDSSSHENRDPDQDSVLEVPAPTSGGRPRIPTSPSSPSLLTLTAEERALAMTVEERADEEKRKRRDKLAKLHRFLGSRVPASLVLGPEFEGAPLPPPVVSLDGTLSSPSTPVTARSGYDDGGGGGTAARAWRRRSSSAAVLSTWSDGTGWNDGAGERLKEDLGEKEKASLVRRAQKMEKVFGVAPPQKLYSAHHSSSPSSSPSHSASASVSLSATGAVAGSGSPASSPTASFGRNQNQAPYRQGSKHPYAAGSGSNSKQGSWGSSASGSGGKKGKRPGTADSDQPLVANAEPSAGSFVYTHYQHSLNSLHDILDRNDKESLAELQQYLNDTSAEFSPVSPLEFAPAARPLAAASAAGVGIGAVVVSAQTKAERRRSLPARTSMSSLASLSSLASTINYAYPAPAPGSGSPTGSPDAVTTEFPHHSHSNSVAGSHMSGGSAGSGGSSGSGSVDFQARRRRAAKLTQFFGVDYRELIDDVLESIEHGLDAERKRGTLNAVEAEDLLQRLRTLKTRR